MTMLRGVGMTLVFGLLTALSAAADEFVLDDGAVLKGAVLKETDTHVFVDVGYTVLDVPRDRIVDRTVTVDLSEDTADDVPADRLYARERQLPTLSLEQAIERFGDGVVVIRVPGALGSGFVIREDGHVITNAHVVQGEMEVTVTVHRTTPDGVEKRIFKDVEIVAVNPVVDLALLRISEEELGDFELTRVSFGDMDEVQKGETVFAVGAPLGMERSVSQGIVSIKNRAENGLTYIQTTAAVNFGNSGGPLFNAKGEVVGVNTWGTSKAFSEGLNFAIPIDFVKHFVDNRDAFAFDRENPNNGYRYLQPPGPDDGDPSGN